MKKIVFLLRIEHKPVYSNVLKRTKNSYFYFYFKKYSKSAIDVKKRNFYLSI